ncbi:hypothetical protein PanWU01x14_334040, partial [Parasponia andersonii]
HPPAIINYPEGTFQSNTDSTPKEKYYTTTTFSGLYDDESVFEFQEKKRDGRNTTMQSDIEQNMNINMASFEEIPIRRLPLMRKLRIKDLREELSCPQPLNQ